MTSPKQTVRASIAQCGSVLYDPANTLTKLRHFATLAKERDHSDLVVFPEAFLGGYPKFSTFGASVGTRTDAGRAEFARYHHAAIQVPDGPECLEVEKISKELDIFIVAGFVEKDGGTLYCSVGFWDPAKGLVYRRRKLMPTASERLIWGFGNENDIKTVKADLACSPDAAGKSEVVLSSAICWENMMPLLRTHYYSQGTQIHCVPTVDGRENWLSCMRHIALEGRCFVLSACQMSGRPPTRQKDFPKDHPVDEGGSRQAEDVMIAGGSVIISPLGEILAGPLRGEEGVISATLELDQILEGKFDLDVTGHYARDDIFKLQVKT